MILSPVAWKDHYAQSRAINSATSDTRSPVYIPRPPRVRSFLKTSPDRVSSTFDKFFFKMFGDHGAPYTRGPMFIAVALTLLPIATIFVSLRFYCRAVLVKSVGVDDWIMLAAMIATWALGVVNIFHIKYGVG